MSAPASVAGAISTVRVAPEPIPLGFHEPVAARPRQSPGAPPRRRPGTSAPVTTARGGPGACRPPMGRPPAWAPCGYLPQQLRRAYGATRSGLTGQGVSIAIMSEDNDSTALSDANRWARARHFPPFRPGQFAAYIARRAAPGVGDGEDALDIEAAHGMAPGARVSYVAGNGKITGDLLLDSLYTIVALPHRRRGQHVLVRELHAGAEEHDRRLGDRAGARGRRGHHRQLRERRRRLPGAGLPGLRPRGSPRSAAPAWRSAPAASGCGRPAGPTTRPSSASTGTSWDPAPPGPPGAGASTGGVSRTFREPYYQAGIVSHNKVTGKGHARRAGRVRARRLSPRLPGRPDGARRGLPPRREFKEDVVLGGTSLAAPLFDRVRGRPDPGPRRETSWASPTRCSTTTRSRPRSTT